MIKKRRSFSSEYKSSILKDHFLNHIPLNEISLNYSIHPTVLYRWKNRLFSNGAQIFEKRIRKISKINIKKAVKNIDLKSIQNRIWMHQLLQGQHKKEFLVNETSSKLSCDEIELLFNEIISRPIRFRNRALSILSYFKGIPKTEIANFLYIGLSTVDSYLSQYKKHGLEKYLHPGESNYKKYRDKNYINSVFKIIHSPPSIYGINRTTYRLKDIQLLMQSEGQSISKQYISRITKEAGYRYRKAKTVLTSTDPNYSEKVDKIKSILYSLGPDEKFFSVDEFGPFAIKKQGGKSLVKRGETKIIPQYQKSKGSLIITGALELSTNQIIHFYFNKKNTYEMIKLLDLIIQKYKNEKCIYFSWDSASWHASKMLYKRIENLNSSENSSNYKLPKIILAPLPAGAQFLNVIESVFSGMAKAIIHNSDYSSVDHCMNAIDLYFYERNIYFLKYPKRAGNKIWGEEREVAVFCESNNCKDPKYR